MKIVIFGPPLSGKTTTARLLSELGVEGEHLSASSLIYRFLNKDKCPPTLKQKITAQINDGKLLEDNFVNDVVLPSVRQHKNFILDGYPRTENQYRAFLSFIKTKKLNSVFVFILELPESEIFFRAERRFFCQNCLRPYLSLKGQEKKIKCLENSPSFCVLKKRHEDQEQVLKKRLHFFKTKTEPFFFSLQDVFFCFKINVSGLNQEELKSKLQSCLITIRNQNKGVLV